MAKRNLSGSYEDEAVTIIGNDPSQTQQITWRTNPCLRHGEPIVKRKLNPKVWFALAMFGLAVIWGLLA